MSGCVDPNGSAPRRRACFLPLLDSGNAPRASSAHEFAVGTPSILHPLRRRRRATSRGRFFTWRRVTMARSRIRPMWNSSVPRRPGRRWRISIRSSHGTTRTRRMRRKWGGTISSSLRTSTIGIPSSTIPNGSRRSGAWARGTADCAIDAGRHSPAFEQPFVGGSFVVRLSPPPSVGPITVNFITSGISSSSDYALSGAGCHLERRGQRGEHHFPSRHGDGHRKCRTGGRCGTGAAGNRAALGCAGCGK